MLPSRPTKDKTAPKSGPTLRVLGAPPPLGTHLRILHARVGGNIPGEGFYYYKAINISLVWPNRPRPAPAAAVVTTFGTMPVEPSWRENI